MQLLFFDRRQNLHCPNIILIFDDLSITWDMSWVNSPHLFFHHQNMGGVVEWS